MKVSVYFKKHSSSWNTKIGVFIDDNTITGIPALSVAIQKINGDGKPTPKTLKAVERLLERRAERFAQRIYSVLSAITDCLDAVDLYYVTPKGIDITVCYPELRRYGITVLCEYGANKSPSRVYYNCISVDKDGIVYRFAFTHNINAEIAKRLIAYAYGGTVPP